MRYQDREPDYFDAHRKDHTSRPFLLGGAIAVTAIIWAALIAGVISQI